MKPKNMINLGKQLRILIPIFLIISFIGCNNRTYEQKISDTYKALETILKERERNLIDYLNDTRELARKVQKDETMNTFFKIKKDYYYLKKTNQISTQIENEIEKLRQNIQHYYLMNYQSFYDILFIDTAGEIFYTIRKQADYHKNIFADELADTELSKKLKNLPNESFVDFQFYKFSGEPSAFFIEPVFEGEKTIGWFVMQCSINKINNLFALNKNLGKTGEVILVNKDHYMLTNSRFKVESTILKQELSQKNIDGKFKEKRGRKPVVDYRGKEVLSTFDVFDFLNSEWLIIAKIDKSEILTQYYLDNKKRLFPKLRKSIVNQKAIIHEARWIDDKVVNVDMDEFQRVDTSKIIYTQGVSSCTAVSVTCPGRFSYLAHVSPYDIIYNENRTDLLGQLFKQISYFDINESEKQDLQFYIMSTQLNSLEILIDKITEKGFFLSQIKFAYNPVAVYGNMYSNCRDNKIIVNWKLQQENDKFISYDFNEIPSFEMILTNSGSL